MILVLDIGNTHTAAAVFQQETLTAQWKFTTSTRRTEDELWLLLRLFCDQEEISTEQIQGVVVSSDVPSQTDIYRLMSEKYLKTKPVIVSSSLPLGIAIHYDNPASVGADRLCNAVAAYEKYGGPVIIIDLGTAITFDVVSKRGDYLGGAIMPGLETSTGELHSRTAKLPKVDLTFPKNIIGTSTTESIQSGILYGTVEALEGMIRRIKKKAGARATVVATGGHAKLMLPKCSCIDYFEPTLVLDGARIIYERSLTQRRKKR